MLAVLVLLFRRLPIVLAVYKIVPALRTWREAIFCGWFGPIGVGALFYYTEALKNFEEDGPQAHVRAVLAPVVYFMILASVFVHGFTIPLFHIGTFASRTLTRTSMSSNTNTQNNSIMRLPMFSQKQQQNGINEKEGDVDLPDLNPTIPEPALSGPPRHTAITIVVPERGSHTTPDAKGQSNTKDDEKQPGRPYDTTQHASSKRVDDLSDDDDDNVSEYL